MNEKSLWPKKTGAYEVPQAKNFYDEYHLKIADLLKKIPC
jgi:hypothetical protein